jgi:hypothetical protein
MRSCHCPAFLCAALLGASRTLAGSLVTDVPQLGPHYKILTVEKSVNPQNTLVAYTRLDDQCRVIHDPKHDDLPVLDYYWLMDRSKYKPVNSMIKHGIRKRLRVERETPAEGAAGAFSVLLEELKEVDNDLESPQVRIHAEKTEDGGCRVEGRITLGPADGGAVIRLDVVHSEAERKGLFGAKVKSLTLKGVNVKTGEPVVRVYHAK